MPNFCLRITNYFILRSSKPSHQNLPPHNEWEKSSRQIIHLFIASLLTISAFGKSLDSIKLLYYTLFILFLPIILVKD